LLGRFFQYQIQVQVQADHKVVTAGPYRWVRHPSYTGMALAIAGFGLASGDVFSLAAAVVLSGIGLVVRIRVEERQLTRALGAEYEGFAAERSVSFRHMVRERSWSGLVLMITTDRLPPFMRDW
jgi:protein-S-isoprenylcysteine O-methyltransferase Ste14